MPPDLRSMLNSTEQALLREADDLGDLDEDELIALHDRIRRARNKYSKLYRRRASAQVTSDASRSRAHAAHAKAATKAELFEDALARVSRRLAAEAKAAADTLKKERIAAARGERKPAKGSTAKTRSKSGGKKQAATSKKPRRSPASEKARASSKASTKRRQASRDKRNRG